MALAETLNKKMDNPYFRPPPLTIVVIKMVENPKVITWDFTKKTVGPATIKKNTLAIISDGKTLSKLTLFEKFGTKIKSGQTYIVRGYSLRGDEPPYYINVDGRTMFFRTTDLSVSDDLCKQADLLLNPASPLTPLSEWHTRQGLLTIEGQVVEASPVNKLKVGKDFVPMRKITVRQDNDSVEVGLWREAAVHKVDIGDRVVVTHLMAAKHAGLQSTANTTFAKPETAEKEASILGVMEEQLEEGFLQLLLDDDTVFDCRTDLWSPIAERLKEGPIKAQLEIEGKMITKISVISKEE